MNPKRIALAVVLAVGIAAIVRYAFIAALRSQQADNLSQLRPDAPKHISSRLVLLFRFGPCRTRLSALAMALFQRLPCAHQRVSFLVNQALDLQRHLHIAPPVKPLSGSALVGLELRKLRLPEPKNIGFHFANAGHVSNLEVETVRNRGRICSNAFAGKLCSHNAGNSRGVLPRTLL